MEISVEGLVSIEYELASLWTDGGYPLINISGQTIPNEILIQQLISPTDLNLVDADISGVFEEAYSNNLASNDLINNSGCYYTEFTGDSKSPLVSKFKQMQPSAENTDFSYSYGIRYVGVESQAIYSMQVQANNSGIISMATQPILNNINLAASGVVDNSTDTKLYMNFDHGHELVNPLVGASKYEIYIEDKNATPQSYGLLGSGYPVGTIPAENVINSGNFFIDLPFTHINEESEVVPTNYFITLKYYNQEDIPTKYIKFNTDQIQKFNDDFERGQDFPQKVTPVFRELEELFMIDTDISEKRRLSLDVSDIYLESSQYHKTGKYTSKYYNIDVPLYSIFLKVDDHFPSDIAEDSIKYYIQLGQQEPIRISPSNKEAEFIYVNNKREQLSKFIILDKLNLQGIADVSEVNIDAPIYSFRVIIEFDIRTTEGPITSEYFIPPFIDSYECHITDRQSYLRM